MKILIIYDSFFGNTEKIAQAMGAALGLPEGSGVIKVANLKIEQLTGVELLIVGSPTRGFRPSDATRNFLNNISADGLKGVHVAAFDTRIKTSDIKQPVLRFLASSFGYAAKPIASGLVKKGGSLAVTPEGFYVKASEGPLLEGELERAAAWATQISAS